MLFRLLLFILLPFSLFSQTLELTNSMNAISSIDFIEVYEDPSRTIDINQIKTKQFQIQENNITTHSVTSSAWWIRLKVQNNYTHQLAWKFKMMFELTDNVEVWQFSNDKLIKYQLKGDHNIDRSNTPYSDRSIYSFITDKNAQNEIYFKISFEKAGWIELYSTIWSPDNLTSHLEKNINILIAILTALTILLFYNFFILIVLKTKIYFWYILYLLGVILIILTFHQVGAHYIWYNSIALIDFMPIFGFILVNISFLLFTRSFLETKQRLKRIDILIKIMLVLNICCLLLALTDLRLIAMKIIPLISFSFFFFPFIGAYLWKKGFTIARGYTIASSILSISITLTLIRALGIIPTNEFLYWVGRLGFIVEGVLLAIALADRINIIQKSYNQAQNTLNHELEEKVNERTKELENLKKIAENLARKDTLTGIWNRRAFLEMAQLEIDNAHRHNIPLCIIMIDIDKFKRFNDTYGHEVGDVVLKSFSKSLKSNTRDTDIFARLGGEEFVMVLPFLDIINAQHKAEKLRIYVEQQDITDKNTILNVTASFGVAQLKLNESLKDLLSRADNAMYYVKNNGRNGVKADET